MNIRTMILPAAGLLGALLLPLAAQATPQSVNHRVHNQSTRIEQGVKHDQLTQREARADRARLDRVRYQDTRDRAFHHGSLTLTERRHQERELNRDSRDIYRTKHNDHVR